MAPGADLHADVAVGADFTPVVKASFGIYLPAQGSVDLFLFIQRYGV